VLCKINPDHQLDVPAVLGRKRMIPLVLRDGAVFIHGQVNGTRAVLLIDTGAILTTLKSKLVPVIDPRSKITMNIAKGSVPAFRVPVGIVLGSPSSAAESCSFRLNAVVGDFEFGEADGVVGMDILSSFKSITFDLKNAVLVLEAKSDTSPQSRNLVGNHNGGQGSYP
jgi:hypothetical protein